MDGVTDQAMRLITKKYGQPDLLTTEFVNVEGWHHARSRLYPELAFDQREQPLIAQIYGVTPAYFAETTRDIIQLGFSGVEINFGCPAKTVVHSGAGASMIKNPDLARQIVLTVQETVQAFAPGLPVSIKTRIGYDTNTADDWIPFLLALHPSRLTIHGRTLRQGYTGTADWDTIGRMKQYRDSISPSTLLFGNGDIQSRAQAEELIAHYDLDGVLIGRAAIGNPWVFTNHAPTIAERARVAIEHSYLFERLGRGRDKYLFAPMRKHLAAYIAAFPDAKSWRLPLMQATCAAQVEEILVPLVTSDHLPLAKNDIV